MSWLLLILATAPLVAQAPSASSRLEGPLNNDSFQPTNLTAEQLFASGRAALETGPTSAEALESLRSALAASNPGEGLKLPAAPGVATALRTVLGVEAAVLDVLDAASPETLAAWSARFEDLARESGTGAAELERHFPATQTAVEAALRLADTSFEAGRRASAATYLDRAERHLALLERAGRANTEGPGARAAIERRRRALELTPPEARLVATHELPAAWAQLDELPRPEVIPFEFAPPDEDPYLADLIGSPVRHALDRGPSTGLRPGLVALGPSLVAVQTAAGLHLIDLSRTERARVVEPAKLIEPAFGSIGPSRAARTGGAPGWPHLPRAGGDQLLVVVGRTEPGRGPNALAALSIASLRTAAKSALDLEADSPRASWILSGSRLFRDGSYADPDLLAPLEGGEIQPGPAIVDDSVLVEVRVLDGEVKTYLAALALATGEPRWVRLVSKGGELGPLGGARFSTARLPLGAAAPLFALEDRVLVQTNLGVTALFEAADGRLIWSFKNRRRNSAEPGWSGLAPRPLKTLDGTLFAVAPADSDFAYLLAPVTPAPLAAPPLPLGLHTDLLASAASELITATLAGGERALSELDPFTGRHVDSILLRRGETFVGLPAASPTRLLASSNRGLFLFDRTRELSLLDFLPLPGGIGPREAGGSVYTLGPRVLILGPGTLWILDSGSPAK